MATIKSYTDLEQSKVLSKILSDESADMSYRHFAPNLLPEGYCISVDKVEYETDIPCWSLASLLGVLPSVIQRNGKRMFLTLEKAGVYNLYYKSPDRLDELWETKEESIDACVAMIESLHELKML